MGDAAARIRISISEGTFEFEGDSSFVSGQVAKWEETVRQLLSTSLVKKNLGEDKPANPNGSTGPKTSLSDFENVFAIADDKVQVIKSLTGNSNSEKSINAALLIGFANQLLGRDSVSFETIRVVCKAHGCLDASNFAKSLRAQKSAFVIGGSAKASTVSLTVPGRKRAEALATSMNS